MMRYREDNIHTDANRDQGDEIVFKIGDKSVNIKKTGAHGFWSIHYPQGRLPKQLEGKFTTYKLAEATARAYLTNVRKVKDKE